MRALAAIARRIDAFDETVGRVTAWLAFLIVIVQFTVVVLRYVFGVGFIQMQESVVYMHAVLFLAGAGYTLLHDGHVRVDIFYRGASARAKAAVDLVGVIVFLVPFVTLVWWTSWPYVRRSWQALEGSRETSGIHAVYLLKTVILVFATLVLLQGLAMALRAIIRLAVHTKSDDGVGLRP